jgi:hypothetical protein
LPINFYHSIIIMISHFVRNDNQLLIYSIIIVISHFVRNDNQLLIYSIIIVISHFVRNDNQLFIFGEGGQKAALFLDGVGKCAKRESLLTKTPCSYLYL